MAEGEPKYTELSDRIKDTILRARIGWAQGGWDKDLITKEGKQLNFGFIGRFNGPIGERVSPYLQCMTPMDENVPWHYLKKDILVSLHYIWLKHTLGKDRERKLANPFFSKGKVFVMVFDQDTIKDDFVERWKKVSTEPNYVFPSTPTIIVYGDIGAKNKINVNGIPFFKLEFEDTEAGRQTRDEVLASVKDSPVEVFDMMFTQVFTDGVPEGCTLEPSKVDEVWIGDYKDSNYSIVKPQKGTL